MTGCSKVSPGCAHCYAETFAERFRGVPGHPYEVGFDLTLREERLRLPLAWRKPRTIFVNSMSDLFHEDVPDAFIQSVFETMQLAHWHRFQLLTKRPERAVALAPRLPWPRNVWMGTSVENQRWVDRIEQLREIPAFVRFLSCEPLLGPLQLDLDGVDWVIVGGESGNQARPMAAKWAQDIRDQCEQAKVAFFFKQWGRYGADGRSGSKSQTGRMLDGREWNEYPVKASVAETSP